MDDRRILEIYPLPIARGYRRYLNATEVKERHDLGYFLFEIYLKYLASAVIAGYLAGEDRDHRVNAVLKGLLRPSLGEWVRFLRECLEFLVKRDEPDPAFRSMAALLKEKEARRPGTLSLYNRLRGFRTKEASTKEAVSLESLLDELVAFRNRVLGHGAPLDREEYRIFADLFGPAFGEILERSPFLTARRLVSFDSIRVQEGSRVECAVVEFMGNQPVRRQEPHWIPYGDPVPKDSRLYLLSDDGAFLSLDPLLVAHREDVYVLNEAQGAPEYLSYSTGERYRPSDLQGRQGELFERILGYRVDSTRISQISEEVTAAAKKVADPAIEPDLKDGERRLGDYRILGEIGRGGMGTVFEALQESLGRRVALKVLPGTFALESKRLERFRREARATARIHHPNIVPVYEVGEAQGTHYYAMEFIDGPSLDQILASTREEIRKRKGKKGSSTTDPAYISNAVEQMAALADGIEEAHRQGLVHRDVKPSNVLVDRSGRWVLVDFGLVHDIDAETITRSGELVGTLAYMSPEQISRQRVDARSDVFSLGVTLYEVLTLRPPFGGRGSNSSQPSDPSSPSGVKEGGDYAVQRAILFDEPVPPRRLNQKINRDLETILLHAIEKKPDRRYPSAAEFQADLKRFLRYEPIAARPRGALTRLWSRARRHKGKVGVAAALAFIFVASFFAWRYWPEKHSVLVNQRRLTSDPGLTTEPSLSPDGKLVVYASDRSGEDNLDLWVQPVDGSGDPRRLTGDPADDREPAFSPDGKSIVFRSERNGGGVYLVPVEGGEASLIGGNGHRPRYSPDGKRIAYWTGIRGTGAPQITGKIFVVGANGGEPTLLQPQFASARFPVWSPTGAHLLFLGLGSRDFRARPEEKTWDWWVTPLDGGEAVPTGASAEFQRLGFPWLTAVAPGHWIQLGDRVFFSVKQDDRESLWSVPISTRTLSVTRSPCPLTQGTGHEMHPWAVEGGRMVFTSSASIIDIWSLPPRTEGIQVTAGLKRLTDNPAAESTPHVTLDGTLLAYTSNQKGNWDVWLKDLASGRETQITAGAADENYPVIDPTGSKLAYSQYDGGSFAEVRAQRIGETSTTTLWKRRSVWRPVWDWSPDGGELLIADWLEGSPLPIWTLDVEARTATIAIRHREKNLFLGHFSPDGRWVTFLAVSGGSETRSQVLIAPYHKGRPVDEKEWISITEGWGQDDKPCWSADGKSLYFISDRDGFRCIWFQSLDPQSKRPVGAPEALYHFHSARRSPTNVSLADLELSVARDKIVINLGELTGNIWLAELEEQY